MKTLMNQLLVALRQRVTENLATLRSNEKEIRNILGEPLSNQRSYNLSNRQAFGKNILMENAENLKIQNMIVSFLSNYKDVPDYTQILESIGNFEQGLSVNGSPNGKEHRDNANETPSVQKSKIVSPKTEPGKKMGSDVNEQIQVSAKVTEKISQSLLDLTTSGKLSFNKAHPKYKDQEFFEQLLNYHIQREEYEICASLIKTRK